MSDEVRASLLGGLWFLTALVLVALFISAAAQGELTPAHIGLTFVFLALAIGGTPLVLRWNGSQAQQEKMKRQRLETMLRDMSPEELAELKQRLADSDDLEASTLDHLSDDGELVLRH